MRNTMDPAPSARSPARYLTVALLFGLHLFVLAARGSAATLNVPAQFATIQAAINAAGNGDTVLVAAGFYSENLVLASSNDIILRGAGAASTTIDGAAAGPVITIRGGQSRATVVEGFTIQNGAAPDGGGILITLDSAPTIRNNTIRLNTATSAGGGIKVTMGNPAVTGSNPRIEGNLIENNTSGVNGGGIHVINSTAEIVDNEFLNNVVLPFATSSGGGIKVNFTTASVLISRNTISGNTVTFAGGGISVFGGDAEIVDNVISGNSGPNGGGIHLETTVTYGDKTFLVRGNCIDMNSATVQGGGIHTFMQGTASPVDILDNVISNNSCLNSDPDLDCKGGGISAIGGTQPHWVRGNSFENNMAEIYGAGLFGSASSFPETMLLSFEGNRVTGSRTSSNYPGIGCDRTVLCDVLGNVFSDNRTEPEPVGVRNPGALYLTGNDAVNIENNFFFENFGSLAGAVQVVGGTQVTRFANNTFADNLAGSTSGGSVRVESAADFVNNIFSGDRYAVRAFGSPALEFLNNDFRDQSSGIVTGGPSHTTVASLDGESFASGNLDLDPGFLDPAADRYRLASGSSMLSAALCAEAPADDFDGESRPLGGGCDIGADEHNPAGTAPPSWPTCGAVFTDGFESGDTSVWSLSRP